MDIQCKSRINVSVIIPAHNAAKTISETFDSLLAQTHRGWEAILVDDGSNDGTAAIAASFAEKDPRIRTVSQPQGGVCAARNTGIAIARYDWLLFLDADDWLMPDYLERVTDILISDPGLDVVYCGSARVSPDGMRLEESLPPSGDMFATLARYSAFPIHACVVRKSLVEAVGNFDTSLRTCEDWDLWQRIARTGAHFGVVSEVLALYRMRPASASVDAFQMLEDGLRVLKQGHAPDARVRNPHPAYANGLPAEQLPGQLFYFPCWCAGLMIGSNKDARPLLSALRENSYPELDPHGVAQNIYRAALLPTCRTPDTWIELWPIVAHHIDDFLIALEEQSKASGVARRSRTALERMILNHSTAPRPLTVGTTHAVRVEVTETIKDIFLPASVERLQCAVEFEGSSIGTTELPVCDGFVPGYVLTDAIAAEFAWTILGRFFERTIYPDLVIRREPTGLSIWRGSLRLAESLPGDERVVKQQMHERIGWTVFLQEIWGRPDWSQAHFYQAGWKVPLKEIGLRIFSQNNWRNFFKSYLTGKTTTRQHVDNKWITIEVSDELPDVEVAGQELDIVLTAGGVILGVVVIPVKSNIVRAPELRVTLTKASGFELCRAAVREALLGKPTADKAISLRDRLVTAKSSAVTQYEDVSPLKAFPDVNFIPGCDKALGHVLLPGNYGIILARHIHGGIGTSASRRATLPAATATEIIDAASVAGEPVIQAPASSEQPRRVVYAPELFWHPLRSEQVSSKEARESEILQMKDMTFDCRSYFDTIFSAQTDPWNYTSQYEQTKYEQTLALLPSTRFGHALELACAEGHFTVQLAPRVGDLIAADISQIALDRAAKRCSGMKNVSFLCLDLTKDPLPGHFDLIVCSEVLYYVGGRKDLAIIARKLTDALNPGGYLLMAHAHVIVDDPEHTGFNWDNVQFGAKVISETFSNVRNLRLAKELRTPLYRIQLFQRVSRIRLPFYRGAPEITELTQQPTPLSPDVATDVLWDGKHSHDRDGEKNIVTDRLPILMYHRVAPSGKPSTARYRVTPESFEEQLRYLREAGYYSVSLEDWHTAMEKKRPLPGRAVLITFDDGYLDFLTYAWPLLKRYGFLATVFIVADHVGGTNSWDSAYGEEIPLLGWEDIRRLQDEGVVFGSHSVSHPCLTALSPEKIVREGARSRAILERELGLTVKAFAYPYGDVDQVVQHLIGACGYIFGLSCRRDLSGFHDPLLELPRLEVFGTDSLQSFVAKLGICQTQEAPARGVC